tara:strand:- start:13 stop:309 length:297 start_codon:yes stop_codon:yes gene_type:complete
LSVAWNDTSAHAEENHNIKLPVLGQSDAFEASDLSRGENTRLLLDETASVVDVLKVDHRRLHDNIMDRTNDMNTDASFELMDFRYSSNRPPEPFGPVG